MVEPQGQPQSGQRVPQWGVVGAPPVDQSWSKALHPDDIAARMIPEDYRPGPLPPHPLARMLGRLTGVSIAIAIAALLVTAGLTLWSLGTVTYAVGSTERAAGWVQDQVRGDTAPAPAVVTDRVAADYEARIVATHGDGVRVRTACADTAVAAGAISEGTVLRVIATGSGDCAGWSLAVAPGGAETWVNDRYLSALAS